MHFSRFIQSALVLVATFVAIEARADIYSYTDDRGVTHFTNVPQLDKRFKLVYKDSLSEPQTATTTKVKGVTGLQANRYSAWKPSKEDMARYALMIDVNARNNGLDPALVHAVIKAESAYNPNAVSPKGASGLMQLMPDTAKRFGVTSIFDPQQNIQGGTRYLAELLRMFNNNLELAVAGYNAGEGSVIKAGNKVPNFNETLAYVPKVMGFYRSFNPAAPEAVAVSRPATKASNPNAQLKLANNANSVPQAAAR
jgi:soluble lytic murein transglycosylase-like protein